MMFIKFNIQILGLLKNRELTLEAHFKYIEEEIEIRIESIKINLDESFETFKKDLVEIKKEIIGFRKLFLLLCFNSLFF